MDTKKIETVLTTVTIDSKVDSGKIDVVVGESAKMDVVKAVNYIQSGKAEIEAGVTEVLNQVDDHVAEKTAEFDQNAQDKTDAFNSNAVDKTGDFNDNYTNKLNAFNQNALDKTAAFDDNATAKTSDFNTNATNKTTDFNDNYVAKKALIDAEVQNAQTAATNASNSADLSKQWAIGDPTEPSEGSAKYWAEQASQTLPNDGQLDIQVNGSSIATFTANQSGNTTADITIPSSLPDQTGNAGKYLSTDGTDASWEYSISDKGYYSYATQYYPGDLVRAYTQGSYHWYLCTSPSKGDSTPSDSKWLDLSGYITNFYRNSSDQPILSYTASGWSGNTMSGIWLSVPEKRTNYAKLPTINQYSGVLKVPSGIDGYSPDSAFGAVAFSNDYDDLDNLPSIPTATSDLNNDSGFITSSALTPYALSSSLSAVATSGAYSDLSGTPTIPTVNNPTITITQGGTTKGSFTLNQSANASIDLDSGVTTTITYDATTETLTWS